MEYVTTMRSISKEGSAVKAVGTVKIGSEVTIKSLSLMEGKDGKVFLTMPGKKTGRRDKDGKETYEDICHPINAKMRKDIENAAIESYENGGSVSFSDEKSGELAVSVECFDAPYYNRLARASLTINDCFVIKNVFINSKQDGSLYVTMPNYKTNQKDQQGRDLYSEIVVMEKGLKKKVCEEVLSVYRAEQTKKEKNRISIKSRLTEATKKTEGQEKNPSARTEKVLA